MREFDLGDISWRYHAASNKTSFQLLKIIGDNLLTWKVLHPTQGNSILVLVMTDKDELITGLEVASCLGASDHHLIPFNMA